MFGIIRIEHLFVYVKWEYWEGGEKVMQFFKRGEETLVLDGNEMYTLERAVDTLAMAAYEDYVCLKRGEKNNLGQEPAMDSIKNDLEVLNALSNALLAIKR